MNLFVSFFLIKNRIERKNTTRNRKKINKLLKNTWNYWNEWNQIIVKLKIWIICQIIAIITIFLEIIRLNLKIAIDWRILPWFLAIFWKFSQILDEKCWVMFFILFSKFQQIFQLFFHFHTFVCKVFINFNNFCGKRKKWNNFFNIFDWKVNLTRMSRENFRNFYKFWITNIFVNSFDFLGKLHTFYWKI